jgi:hypothetical protein
MSEISTGFKARLEYVLDQICAETEHGGSHEMRCFIAEQLMAAAQAGERSVDDGPRSCRTSAGRGTGRTRQE